MEPCNMWVLAINIDAGKLDAGVTGELSLEVV
jgi:hypothetical protein